MNRFTLTLLAGLAAASFSLPALAVDDTANTGTTSHSETSKEMHAKWKSMTPAERKEWKAQHPEEVKKFKEHKAKKKAMKEGSASSENKESIAK